MSRDYRLRCQIDHFKLIRNKHAGNSWFATVANSILIPIVKNDANRRGILGPCRYRQGEDPYEKKAAKIDSHAGC